MNKAPDSLDLIVVDDGSSDAGAHAAAAAITQENVERENSAGTTPVRAQIIRQDNSGPGQARNTGVAHSQARYVAFLDSDDCWAPGTAALLSDLLSQADAPELLFLATRDIAPETSMVLAPVQSNLVVAQTFRCFSDAALARTGTRLASCNVVMSRALLSALGGFRADMPCSEDTDLFLRADGHSCTLITQPPIVAHAVGHATQLTGNPAKVQRGLEIMLGQDRKGAYPGGQAMRKVLANSVAHVVRGAFAAGHVRQAYTLYFRHLPRMIAARNWHWALRLPLIPVLHAIRPENFAFRWAPTPRTTTIAPSRGEQD